MDMLFAWDERKAWVNERKHGVSFEEAIRVFLDPHHVVRTDREVDGEQRWQATGMIDGMRILLVAYTVFEEEGSEITRIISARKAIKREIMRYVQNV